MSASSRDRTAKSSGRSSTARGERTRDVTTMPSVKDLKHFDPCAATASMFLYAQGPSILCCHHDTLTIERIFSRHSDEVQLLAVDNQSEAGGGRLVVSYDAGQTAIVWDLMTGDEVARFASYEMLTVAAWMCNGNVVFGNTQGNIILFEPTTSEHLSSRTIDQIAVTALAPSADCRTFAIGYQNGSLLIATLQPRFTILHNLTTARAPSPIVTLAWHASSSRQKSDMLAVQTHDGDLRVWSVAKSYSADDPAKVVRILRRRESFVAGPNWMGWSKNGRIIQYSDSYIGTTPWTQRETLSWDVRTKHVTFDSIPTLEHVRGLAVYGPGATLFTLGRAGTAQQFDLNSPSIIVANVQHPTNLLPPSPPNSVEEPGTTKPADSVTTIHTSESESSSVPFEVGVSESDEDHSSPFARLSRQPHLDSSGARASASPVSSRSGMSSLSRSSAGSRTPGHHHPTSMRSRGMTENTYISAGSSIKSSIVGRKDLDGYSLGYTLPSTSAPSIASSQSRFRPSRLRHEVPRSPDDNKVHDLFKFTRSRLSDIPYKHAMNANNGRLTNDDLRKQMLSTIFGWHRPIEDLIRDEMTHHPAGSASRILLAKWLGDMEVDLMAGSCRDMSSSDWMFLALSGIGGQQSQHKLGYAYVQRLLETGDVHVAVTIMLGMGDQNDAIEVYVSHKRYMEALILTCVAFPAVWERQAAIIRKWGEWAVQHGQQQLAIRCFACTDRESTEPWSSPSAAQLTFQSMAPDIPEVLSPPLSPPGVQRGPQRSIAKASALKLITSFADHTDRSRFHLQGDGGQTPLAAGVTPIAESAISPGVNDATTAFLRPSNSSRFNTPTSACPTGSSHGRGRLPSIGEIPLDLTRDALRAAEGPGGQATQEKHLEAGHSRKSSADQDAQAAAGISMHRAATASPQMARDDFRQSVTSSIRYHWPSRRRGPGSSASSVTSSSSVGRNLRAPHKQREEFIIHGLETTRLLNSKRNRSCGASTDGAKGADEAGGSPSPPSRSGRGREGIAKSREASEEEEEDRGRSLARGWAKHTRSPTSPVPMSPEDLANLSTRRYFGIAAGREPVAPTTSSSRKASSSSRQEAKKNGSSRASSRGSGRRSPEACPRLLPLPLDFRGRGQGHGEEESGGAPSPSSPVPLSANTALHYQGSEDEEDLKRAMAEREGFRARHGRSASRGVAAAAAAVHSSSPAVGKRDRSESRGRPAAEAVDPLPARALHRRAASTDHAGGDLGQKMDDGRQRKKEQASRELEDRRRWLAKRPPPVLALSTPHPSGESHGAAATRIGVEMADAQERGEDLPPRCATEPPRSMYARDEGSSPLGPAATAKAMTLLVQANNNGCAQVRTEAPGGYRIPSSATASPRRHHHQAGSPDHQACSNNNETLPDEGLTLLPSTVYQPPRKLGIPRSISAPIPDEPAGPRRRPSVRGSTGEARGIDEVLNKGAAPRRPFQDETPPAPPRPPPPPPPAAPACLLKELAHLTVPPPPPPAPSPHAQPSRCGGGGALESG
ncbi:hypothetical protein E4U41_001381, partial [Claviceps citrina]